MVHFLKNYYHLLIKLYRKNWCFRISKKLHVAALSMVSLANIEHVVKRSFINIANSVGPRTDPRGNLLITGTQSDTACPSTTRCLRYVRKVSTQYSILPEAQYLLNLTRRLWW